MLIISEQSLSSEHKRKSDSSADQSFSVSSPSSTSRRNPARTRKTQTASDPYNRGQKDAATLRSQAEPHREARTRKVSFNQVTM